MNHVKVAIAQISMHDNLEANAQKALQYIALAAQNGAQMICFPEGQLSYYVPQYENIDTLQFAIGIDHLVIRQFQKACQDHHIIGVFGLCLQEDHDIYACAMVISENGDILGIGKKNHIVQMEHFYEQDYFSEGHEGFCVIDTSIGRIGMIVCFDRHYPESYRTCVKKGADLIIVPVANEKIEPREIFQWEIRIAAYQNSATIMMCNRVGQEGQMDFCGESIIVDANGQLLAEANDQQQLLYAYVDLDLNQEIRQRRHYLPLLREDCFH